MIRQMSRRAPALSAIVGIIIGVGVTAAAGSTLYYTFESQTDPFKSSSALDVRNLSVVKDEDLLRITATLRNNGQTRIDEVTVDKILVSDIEIYQTGASTVKLDIDGTNQTHSTDYTAAVEGLTTPTSHGQHTLRPVGGPDSGDKVSFDGNQGHRRPREHL